METPVDYYVDNHEHASILGAYYDGRLRLEGTFDFNQKDELAKWCAQIHPFGVATTNELMMYMLRGVVGDDGWSLDSHYSVTKESFCDRTTHEVVSLTAADHDAYHAFLEHPADVPFLSIQRSDGKLARDFAFMCAGVPMDCYAVFDGPDIVGALTVQPMTDANDEISRLFVIREYRGRGIARSLISAAARTTLARGRQAACALQGDFIGPKHTLSSMGFHVCCRFWQKRYWSDVPRSGARAISSPGRV